MKSRMLSSGSRSPTRANEMAQPASQNRLKAGCRWYIRQHQQTMLEGSGETAIHGVMLWLANDRALPYGHTFS